MINIKTIVMAGIAAIVAMPAEAATTIYQNSFTATFAAGSPAQTVQGAFKFSYDTVTTATSLIYFSTTIAGTAYTLNNVGLTYDGVVRSNNVNFPTFTIGGLLNGVPAMSSGTNDFMLIYTIAPTGLRDLSYTTAATRRPFGDTSLVLSAFAEIPAAVPEPATWAMMIAGFAIVGAALRRRRPAVPGVA